MHERKDKALGHGPVLTSLANPRVKAVRALKRPAERRARSLCLLEGVRLIESALEAGAHLEEAFVVPGVIENARGRELVEALGLRGVPVTRVSERVLAHMSDTETPQGIVAVARMQEAGMNVFAGCTMLVVSDGIADPGNLGTLVRTAAATGAALWSRTGSADLYEPKALRASMGALFLVPHRQRLSPEQILEATQALGLALVVADARGPVLYTEVDWQRPFALVVGGEAHGVTPALREAAAAVVHLPMRPGVESLNAAVTAAVLLFEAVRQRAAGPARRL